MSMHDVVQGTDAWRALRVGKLTASRMCEALATTKSGWGASRANLIAEIVAERLTGAPFERGFVNAEMQWGNLKEADARSAYEFDRGVDVIEVGFVPHPTIKMSGASPDGLVGDDGLVEIKCPSTNTHIETLLGGKVPAKYVPQMQWQMACTGRRWCDFVSFDPRMPGDMQLFVARVERLDVAAMADLEGKACDFLAEVAAKVEALEARFRREAA